MPAAIWTFSVPGEKSIITRDLKLTGFRLTASLDDMLESVIGKEYEFDQDYQELMDLYPDLAAYDNATNDYFYDYY